MSGLKKAITEFGSSGDNSSYSNYHMENMVILFY